jgi:hypothetical protein
MAKSGDVLEMEPLGVRIELLQTAEETGGRLLELEPYAQRLDLDLARDARDAAAAHPDRAVVVARDVDEA